MTRCERCGGPLCRDLDGPSCFTCGWSGAARIDPDKARQEVTSSHRSIGRPGLGSRKIFGER